MKMLPKPPIDFVIITALEEERDAMLSMLPDHVKLDKDGIDIHTYYSATVQTNRSDRAQYSVIVTSLLGMGPIYAAGKAAAVVARWRPRYVVLVGIAAGVKGKVSLGDVLVARNIADYTLGKQETDGTRTIRWQQFHPDGNLVDSVINLNKGWEHLVKTNRPDLGTPVRYVDDLASGPDVIERDKVVEEYAKHWSKLIGVEMEGGAVACAFYQLPNPPGYLMIRGVSDLAQDKNNPTTKPWRAYACEVASAYTLALLQEGPVVANTRTAEVVRAPEMFALSETVAEEKFAEIKKEIEDLRLSVNVHPRAFPNDVQKFLTRLEAENPALVFSAETTAKGTAYKIAARKGASPTDIGTLAFPNTDSGRLGAEKFQKANDEGVAVDLEPGEFEWLPKIKIPNDVEASRRALRISPNVPATKPPVSIEWISGKGVVQAEVKSAVLSIIRIGAKEVEFKLSGGRLAGGLTLILDRAGKSGRINFSLDLPSQPPAIALETVNLFLALHTDGKMRVTNLDTNTPFFELDGLKIPLDSKVSERNLKHTKRLLASLAVVNEEFNLDIRYPADEVDQKSALIADLLAAAKREGKVAVRADQDEVFQMEADKDGIQGYLEHWKNGQSLNFTVEPLIPYVIFGTQVPVGPVKWQYEGVRPNGTLEELTERVAKAQKSELFIVRLNYDRVIHEIAKYAKT
jgi:nucleoside phosphorylase